MIHKYFDINAPGHSIRCKLYGQDPRAARKAILFCTGFAGHRDNGAAERFAEKALSKRGDVLVLVFDWPAHGSDVKKKLLLADCDAYLSLVIDALRTKYAVEELYACAVSFGAYLLLKYISEHGNPFRKIALRCPAVDMYAVLTRTVMKGDEFDRLQKGREVQVGFDRKVPVSPAFLEELKTNDIRQRSFLDWADDMLILHGTADEVVPIADSLAFAEDNVIELIPIEGADHRFANPTHMSLANKDILQFFDM